MIFWVVLFGKDRVQPHSSLVFQCIRFFFF